MNKIDTILGVFFILFSLIGLIYVVPRETISFGFGAGLSPAFFPNAILVTLCGLSILLIIKNVRLFLENKTCEKNDLVSLKKVLWHSFFTFGSFLGLYYLGFLITGPLVIILAMLIMGENNWRRILLVCLVCPVVIYLIFEVLLKMALPAGILFS